MYGQLKVSLSERLSERVSQKLKSPNVSCYTWYNIIMYLDQHYHYICFIDILSYILISHF